MDEAPATTPLSDQDDGFGGKIGSWSHRSSDVNAGTSAQLPPSSNDPRFRNSLFGSTVLSGGGHNGASNTNRIGSHANAGRFGAMNSSPFTSNTLANRRSKIGSRIGDMFEGVPSSGGASFTAGGPGGPPGASTGGAGGGPSGTAIQLRHRRNQISGKELQAMRATFEKFDEDGSNSIDVDELGKVMSFLGHEVTEKEVLILMKQIDVDGSGTLDFDEFAQLLRLYKEAAQFKLMEDETGNKMSNQDLRIKNARQVNNYPTDSFPVVAWQLVVLAVSIFFFFAALYLDTVPDGEYEEFVRSTISVDSVISVLFLLDIFVSMRISSKRNSQDYINRWYLKYRLCFDLISLLPMGTIALTGKTDNPENYILVSRILYHFRLFRLVKAFGYFKSSGRMEATRSYVYVHFYILPIIRILCFYGCFVHAATVIYYFVRTEVSGEFTTYIQCLYFVAYSVTGVGYGTFITVSGGERMYAALMCLCAQVFSAIIVGSVVKIVAQSDVTAIKQHKTRYMKDVTELYNFPDALRDEMIGYQDHLEEDSLSDAYKDLIENLPVELQSNITLFVKMRLISHSSLFHRSHRATQVAIAEELESKIFKPSELVYLVGDERTDMYFIVYGFVTKLGREGEFIITLKAGEHFAEEGMLTGYSDKLHSARCDTYCELFVLSRLSFVAVLRQFPLFRVEMQRLAEERRQRSPAGTPEPDSKEEVPLSHRRENSRKKMKKKRDATGVNIPGPEIITEKVKSSESDEAPLLSVQEPSAQFDPSSEADDGALFQGEEDEEKDAGEEEDEEDEEEAEDSSELPSESSSRSPVPPPGIQPRRGRSSKASAVSLDLDVTDDRVEEAAILAQEVENALKKSSEKTARMETEEEEVLKKCAHEMAEIEALVQDLERLADAKSVLLDARLKNFSDLGHSSLFMSDSSGHFDFPSERGMTAAERMALMKKMKSPGSSERKPTNVHESSVNAEPKEVSQFVAGSFEGQEETGSPTAVLPFNDSTRSEEEMRIAERLAARERSRESSIAQVASQPTSPLLPRQNSNNSRHRGGSTPTGSARGSGSPNSGSGSDRPTREGGESHDPQRAEVPRVHTDSTIGSDDGGEVS